MMFRRLEPSSMTLPDRRGEVFVRVDFRRKLVSRHLNHIETGQQAVRIAQRQTLLGEKDMSDQHQRHMVIPSEPATHLLLGHDARAFGILQRPLDEVARRLHRARPMAAHSTGRISACRRRSPVAPTDARAVPARSCRSRQRCGRSGIRQRPLPSRRCATSSGAKPMPVARRHRRRHTPAQPPSPDWRYIECIPCVT